MDGFDVLGKLEGEATSVAMNNQKLRELLARWVEQEEYYLRSAKAVDVPAVAETLRTSAHELTVRIRELESVLDEMEEEEATR